MFPLLDVQRWNINLIDNAMTADPMMVQPRPPFAAQQQGRPGSTDEMTPRPDHGEYSYRGSGKLSGRVALVTGADSGIGRAVAIAFAREGADVLVSYLCEDREAQETAHWVENAGQRALTLAGDVADPAHCRELVNRAVGVFGRLDVLVNNAAFQATHESIEEITDEEWDHTFRTNIYSMFYLVKAALPHLRPGSTIVNTASINSKSPSPELLAYATTKGAIGNFTAGLAQLLDEQGVRVNCVASGPIWTPLIPSTMPPDMSGALIPVTGARCSDLKPTFMFCAQCEEGIGTRHCALNPDPVTEKRKHGTNPV
jgi:NAD(P)-dependent dehydrogenase (short-subunit alcohol dehydrogenase family)